MSFASIDSLPKNSEEVSFSLGSEGKISEARYSSIKTFSFGATEAFKAAEAALVENGFKIVSSNIETKTILAEHGMTLYDWNVVAGAYIDSSNRGSIVRLIVQGSKGRVRVKGDMTGRNWTKDIFDSMNQLEEVFLENHQQ